MNTRRLLFPHNTAVYHVVNRLVRREFWLDERCREVFVALLRRQARFAGIEILTYCVMSNHFHLLVRVPPSPLIAHQEGRSTVDDALLLESYRTYYGGRKPLSSYSVEELKARLEAGGRVAEQARCRVLARMGDLSVFVQELKHNFTLWFNAHHENEGTIWSAKFKSIVVEDTVESRSTVAAYIDLNPVRAGIVDDPANYRWCGYAAAMADCDFEREGIRLLFCPHENGPSAARTALASYRQLLFSVGSRTREKPGTAPSGKVDAERAESVLKAKGAVSLAETLRCRWQFISAARAIGSEVFIESLLDDMHTASKRRKPPSRRLLPESFGESLFAISRRRLQR